MKAPPKHPDPFDREQRWLFFRAGFALLCVGLGTVLVGSFLDWGATRMIWPTLVALIGGTMTGSQLFWD